ncbi:MAG: hypothetical protein ACRDRY_25380, partial [Pseudonocardiaceae bacterium]
MTAPSRRFGGLRASSVLLVHRSPSPATPAGQTLVHTPPRNRAHDRARSDSGHVHHSLHTSHLG